MTIRDAAAFRESSSLADAIVELLGLEPQTFAELHAGLVEEWGACTEPQVVAELRKLLCSGHARYEAGGYVRGEA